MLLLAVILAAIVGVLVGVLGGGGSILVLPILRYMLKMDGHSAIVVSLIVVGLTSLFGLIPHWLNNRIHWRAGFAVGVSGMIGAFFAGKIAHTIPASVLFVAFSVVMLAASVMMLRPRPTDRSQGTPQESGALLRTLAITGLAIGVVSGLVGAGGGFLLVPALVILGRIPMEKAVGTSLLIIAAQSLSATVGHLSSVHIDWKITLMIAGFAVMGALVGSLVSARIPQEYTKKSFGILVGAMGSLILTREGLSLIGVSVQAWVPWTIAATVLTTGIVWLAIEYTHRKQQTKHHTDLTTTEAVLT